MWVAEIVLYVLCIPRYISDCSDNTSSKLGYASFGKWNEIVKSISCSTTLSRKVLENPKKWQKSPRIPNLINALDLIIYLLTSFLENQFEYFGKMCWRTNGKKLGLSSFIFSNRDNIFYIIFTHGCISLTIPALAY